MNHSIRLEGFAYALRPIGRSDAGLIVRLRSGDERARFLHPIAPDVASQEAYLDVYFAREGDYYFVVERKGTGEAEGLIALYDLDPGPPRAAELGRWILLPGSLAAAESVWLLYRVTFEELGLDEVYCRTMVENAAVVSFHDSCGLERRRVLPGHVWLGDRVFWLGDRVSDAVEHALSKARWPEVAARLARQAELVGRRIGRMEER